MKHPRTVLAVFALALVALIAVAATGQAQQPQTIKIGLLYDHSGPFSAAGSLNCWRGAKMMIDYINEKGGVLGKHKIVQSDGDSQSKADVAINEAERLLNVEKVDILAGVYSSAHAVPIAERVDKQKKFLLDHDRHRGCRARRIEISSTRSAAAQRQPLRRGLGRLHRQLCAGSPEEGAQGRAHRDHLRGRPVRSRRGRGQRGRGQEAGHADRAQGGLLGPGRGPVFTGDEAPGRAAGCPLPHRLQSRHQPLPPPVEGTGASRARLRRSRRGPQPARQAEGGLRQRGGRLPHRGPAGVPAHRPQEPEAGRGRPDPGDGEALQDVRAEYPREQHRAPRVDGLQQHVDPAQRRAAPGHPEARRLVRRGPRQGRPRDRHPRGRHHAGLWRQVLRRRHSHARPERAGDRGRLPGRGGEFRHVWPKVIATPNAPVLLPASSPWAVR